ncbi:MAG: 16S rRNA (cytosine(1402)-N(4))-methyltransferase RsmH, partial [Patescibacteria group bacterium]
EKTAAYIVNGCLEEELQKIFREFGEERNSRKIARAIVEERKRRKIKTTGELVEIIDKTYKTNRTYRIKTLSRIFQALRIAVNNELENIKKGLEGAWDILKPNGRIVAISFHSLEDRLVKNFFNEKKMIGLGKVLTRKPVTPSAEEVRENTRARSAKLRAIVKISNI